MRISDWSSDVCSSDLRNAAFIFRSSVSQFVALDDETAPSCDGAMQPSRASLRAKRSNPERFTRNLDRSEEHTSELQSLMRISYAVFCLKKKTNTIHN